MAFDVRGIDGKPAELRVGRWYVGVENGDETLGFPGAELPRYGALAKYVGDGEFYDSENAEEATDMRGYDFLIEQH
jgi:hypothetical protein